MDLWMVYCVFAKLWKDLESTYENSGKYIQKHGKKVNVLYIVDQNHQRSVIVVDHSRNFKGI